MQAKQILPKNANNNNQIFDTWLKQTEDAIDALFVWKSYLRAWQYHPLIGRIPDEAFMSVVRDISKAGVDTWLDGYGPELDQLRQVVTGGLS